MAAKVHEDDLLKALAAIEDNLQKGAGDKKIDGKPSMPDTTAEANGALGQEGDAEELAAKSAAALDAYVGKAMADDDDDDDSACKSDSDDDGDDEDEEETMKARKSIADVVKSTAGMSDYLDAAPAMENLIDQVSDAQMELAKSVRGMNAEQSAFNATIAKALAANCQMVLAIKKSLDNLSGQPVGQRKSMLSKSDINQRFDAGADGEQRFNRSDVLKAMCELIEIGKLPSLAVSTYETRNYMEPSVQKLVTHHLQKSA